jgi:hypothetical protein
MIELAFWRASFNQGAADSDTPLQIAFPDPCRLARHGVSTNPRAHAPVLAVFFIDLGW